LVGYPTKIQQQYYSEDNDMAMIDENQWFPITSAPVRKACQAGQI